MDRWVGKVAIVTGASSGIGAATVEALVYKGVKVVGLARRVEKVRELADKLKGQKGKLYAIECDVSKEEDILNAFKWVEKELGGVDILVNNAGVLSTEPIIQSKTETLRKILDVNVLAFAICSREAVTSMRKRGIDGHIIVINSVLGHNADITKHPVNLYSASKYAVTGMTISLRTEINALKLKIKVTSLSPGLVATEMPRDAGIPKDILESPLCIHSKDIAEAVVYALSTPPNVQVSELTIASVQQVVPELIQRQTQKTN